jgi:hypothetical protein
MFSMSFDFVATYMHVYYARPRAKFAGIWRKFRKKARLSTRPVDGQVAGPPAT